MTCAVLCVGTELLLGQIHDTNSAFIGEALADAGISSYEHRRVGDNPDRIASALRDLLKTNDSIIVTGGLGPTHDDITREVTAEVMGVTLEKNSDVVTHMEAIFARRQREMSENNLRQAMVPVGAVVIENPAGTAPGLMCPVGEKWIYLVPGVPHEMKPMIRDAIIPHIFSREPQAHAIVTRTIKTWGIPESTLAQQLDGFVQAGETGDVKIGFLARGINGIYVKLSAQATSRVHAEEMIAPVEREIVDMLDGNVYAFDDDTMEKRLVALLQDQAHTLAIAESLTGGMVASRIVDAPGSSQVFHGGVVSYTEEIKNKILNIDIGGKIADVYSHDCARAMASSVREKFGSTIGLSTTGVAGPDEVDGHKPGEVYVGIATESFVHSEKFLLGGDRIRVREYATISALNVVRRFLLGITDTSTSSE